MKRLATFPKHKTLICLACVAALSASSGLAGEDERIAKAESTLVRYCADLADGNYVRVAGLVDDNYWGALREWNPLVDAADSLALLQNGCRLNGLQCLRLRQIVSRELSATGRVHFVVEFNWSDGRRFVRGPCCGSDDPPDSQFVFEVGQVNGATRVFGMPPYVP